MREPLNVSRLADIIDQARGKAPADLVIKSVGIFDLTSGDVAVGDIAIAGDRIVGTYETYHGATEIDGRGLIAVPGFIDSHVHCESSLVPPLEFDRCVVPRGTTTAICDPHEICNVLGVPGLKFFLECAAVTVMDLRVQLSSCVPSTHLETSGARLEAEDLLPFKHHPKVLGLAEFMNVPGVLNKDPAVLAKLAAFSDVQIDGHSPCCRPTTSTPISPPACATATRRPRPPRRARSSPRACRSWSATARCRRISMLAELIPPSARRSWRSAPTTATRSTSPRKAISIT